MSVSQPHSLDTVAHFEILDKPRWCQVGPKWSPLGQNFGFYALSEQNDQLNDFKKVFTGDQSVVDNFCISERFLGIGQFWDQIGTK